MLLENSRYDDRRPLNAGSETTDDRLKISMILPMTDLNTHTATKLRAASEIELKLKLQRPLLSASHQRIYLEPTKL